MQLRHGKNLGKGFSKIVPMAKLDSSAHHTNILELGIGLTKIFFIDCKHRTAVQRITVNVELKMFLGAFFKSHILQYRSVRCSFLFSRDHEFDQGLDFALSACDSVHPYFTEN